MAKKEKKYAKLTWDDRINICACLCKGFGAKEIAERIGFSVSTVYRELERGSQIRSKETGDRIKERSDYSL
ncbi:MAG: helix-turn-helix domain-containing protein [Candidatus Enteromonas sp.]